MHRRIVYTLLCFSLSRAQTAGTTPDFSDYPVANRFSGKPAPPQFTNPKTLTPGRPPQPADLLPDADERMRETVEIDAERGPNFAGHFTLVRWACGDGCFSIAVIDTPTGRIYREMPFTTLDIGFNRDNEAHRYRGMSFRAASSLLIAEGCFDTESHPGEDKSPECQRRYYLWEGARFTLLKGIPIPE